MRDAEVRAHDPEIADGTLMEQGTTLEDVARRAVDGDREALDGLVRALQGDIYGLALRMLWNQRTRRRKSLSAL